MSHGAFLVDPDAVLDYSPAARLMAAHFIRQGCDEIERLNARKDRAPVADAYLAECRQLADMLEPVNVRAARAAMTADDDAMTPAERKRKRQAAASARYRARKHAARLAATG
jgi:hypothetical protein